MPSLPIEPMIHRAECTENSVLATTLAAAFDNDPVVRYCIRADSRRDWAMHAGFKRALDIYCFYGMTFTAMNGAGVALWARHDQWQLTFWQECMLIPLYVRICGIRRFMRLSRGFETMKWAHPVVPHYYLYMIGVHPDCQSQGLGAALLRVMLERCDREKMPAYLEATHPRNISFYRRHGFQVIRTLTFGPGGPPIAAMWREPQLTAA
ncbi:Acetyltransferase (GNAT) family protein [Nitrosomonas nitrosa]|uniref:Acetyltransferase (GNAT) family protein n=1 Tax=Nitrosomonas nitrosa TaxID=52442 RepID=A0A1I4PXR4_9PROT|nr:N-acetyltransferase [Nitrosomonas nitrosa]SFM32406.1 Acetyltransferase (GNAT) family protein [Nitrosomonas nitrosa]